MNYSKTNTIEIDKLNENLVNYSIDRSEIYQLLSFIPANTDINTTAVEYEIQILKTLAVGWSINYYIEEKQFKKSLSESFWNSIRDFSHTLTSVSTASSASLDKDFNYFEIIKQRLSTYLDEFQNKPDSDNPASVIGPKFAELSGHPQNAIIVWIGSKMFQSVMNQLKLTLSEAKFIQP